MTYRRCGRSGLRLPALSVGLRHGFGFDRPFETRYAVESGINPWARSSQA